MVILVVFNSFNIIVYTLYTYKKCLLNDKVILKSQQRFISNKHDVYMEDVNKIALSNDDDKRIVSLDQISSYPY